MSFMRPVASSPLLCKEKLPACHQAYSCPFLLSFICSCFFKHIVQVGFSFGTFSAVLCPRDFLFFHECVEHSVVRRDLCPLSFRFHVLPYVYRAFVSRCSPLVAATLFSWRRTTLYFSTFHFSPSWPLFKTAVVFFTLDLFLRLSGEREDDKDTLCMVPGSEEAAAAHVSDHSLLFCSSSQLHQKRMKVCVSLSPAILSFLHYYVRVAGPGPPRLTYDFGVCFPPNGFTIASMIAPFTTSWYFQFPRCDSSPWAQRTTTGSIVPRTGHQLEIQCHAQNFLLLLVHAHHFFHMLGNFAFTTPIHDQRKHLHRPNLCGA